MTKNLITGIGGFVASHLVELLLSKKEEVYGTYRWNEDLSKIEHIKDKIHLLPMDLTDLISCMKVIEEVKPDYIYHLGAESYVPEAFRRPQSYLRVNGEGTLNLLEAVKFIKERYKIEDKNVCNCDVDKISHYHLLKYDPVIHLCSSSEVYGIIYENEIPVKENNPFRPANAYGVSKIVADMYGWLYYKNYGLKVIRTRMFTHTGPRRTMESAEVAFAKQIVRIERGLQEPIVKVGNLNSLRTYADVRDAVEAYWLLVRKCKPGEAYNIGGDKAIKIEDMLKYLISQSTYKNKITIEVDSERLRPTDVTIQLPDSSKFKNETGWKPRYSFEQTMQDILNYWRECIK